MDSTVFLALVVLSQIIATHRTLGEIENLVTERRLEMYRKRIVTSLNKIVSKKFPLVAGMELGRATDTHTCGTCFISDKVATDSKCIKSCTKIMRFSNVSPADSETKECDTCVATALNRPNRDCEDTCSVAHLTRIMAEVVSEAISFREKTLLQASVEHHGGDEPVKEQFETDNESVETWFRTRKSDNADGSSEDDYFNQYNDYGRSPEPRSSKLDYLSVFRINSEDNGNESDITEVSGKIDEDFLNKREDSKSNIHRTVRSVVHKHGFDNSGRFVHPKGRHGSSSGSSHQLLNIPDIHFVKFKNVDKINNFFHPDNTFVSARSYGTDKLKSRTDHSEESDYEDLSSEQRTKQASRSNGDFNLRDILSESVNDLNDKQQARIIKNFKKLGDDPQSNRSSRGFNQRTKSDDVKDSDYFLRASELDQVNDLNDKQQPRIVKSLKRLGDDPQSNRGSRGFNQRTQSDDVKDSDYFLRASELDQVNNLNDKQQARIIKSLRKLGDDPQSNRGSRGFNQRTQSDDVKDSDNFLRASELDQVNDLNDKQQPTIVKSLKKLGDDPQSNRGSRGFNKRTQSDDVKDSDYFLEADVKDLSHAQQKYIPNAFTGLLSSHPIDASGGVHSQQNKLNARSDSSRYKRPTSKSYDDEVYDDKDEDYADPQDSYYRIRQPRRRSRVVGSNDYPPRSISVHEYNLPEYKNEGWA